MTAEAIFVPAFLLVLLTVVLWVRMTLLRRSYLRDGTLPPDYLESYRVADPPRDLSVTERHFSHLFQVPVLFYLAIVALYAAKSVDGFSLFLAWVYLGARTAQCAIHLTYNSPAYRGIAYGVGWIVVLCLWGRLVSLAGCSAG